MVTSVAFSVRQFSVVGWPFCTVVGFALSEAVGVGGGGGGAGGGGGGFFLQAPRASTMTSAATKANHFLFCFTSNSLHE